MERISCHEMVPGDLDFLYGAIRDGLFGTDRVSLDPHFTAEQSSNRYVYWIRDELDRGAKACKLVYRDSVVGFFTLKQRGPEEWFAFLGGLYPDFLTSRFGFVTYCLKSRKPDAWAPAGWSRRFPPTTAAPRSISEWVVFWRNSITFPGNTAVPTDRPIPRNDQDSTYANLSPC